MASREIGALSGRSKRSIGGRGFLRKVGEFYGSSKLLPRLYLEIVIADLSQSRQVPPPPMYG